MSREIVFSNVPAFPHLCSSWMRCHPIGRQSVVMRVQRTYLIEENFPGLYWLKEDVDNVVEVVPTNPFFHMRRLTCRREDPFFHPKCLTCHREWPSFHMRCLTCHSFHKRCLRCHREDPMAARVDATAEKGVAYHGSYCEEGNTNFLLRHASTDPLLAMHAVMPLPELEKMKEDAKRGTAHRGKIEVFVFRRE